MIRRLVEMARSNRERRRERREMFNASRGRLDDLGAPAPLTWEALMCEACDEDRRIHAEDEAYDCGYSDGYTAGYAACRQEFTALLEQVKKNLGVTDV